MPPNNKVSKTLNLLNWNANGIIPKRASFIHFLESHKIDVACITETHLPPQKAFRIPNYSCYRYDRPSQKASGGVAILVNRAISHGPLSVPQNQAIEAKGIQINLSQQSTLYIFAAYRPPNKRSDFTYLSKLFNSTHPSILLGDLNAKNTNWGCNITSPPGVALQNILNQSGLQIHSPMEPTHYSSNETFRPDILDIAISKNLNFQLHSYIIPELDSDHCPVIFSTSTLLEIFQTGTPKLNINNINWLNFQSIIDSRLEFPKKLTTTTELDDEVSKYTNTIVSAVTLTAPSYNKPHITHSLPQDILQLITLKHKIRHQWQKHHLPILKQLLNRLSRKTPRPPSHFLLPDIFSFSISSRPYSMVRD